MLKRRLLLALAGLLPCYSYSDSIIPYYGYTGNAAADNALRWSMQGVLPDPPGLDIENVIYSYRIQKETGEWVTVYVSNENASGSGYIFRERDDWKPGSLSGTEINKVVPLGGIHRDLFGDGSIEVEGNGSVYDTSVVYTYRVDPCYNPQFDPNCPGYEIPTIDVEEVDLSSLYDPFEEGHTNRDQYNEEELYDDEEKLTEDELAENEKEEEKDREERLEKALAEAGRSALFAEAFAVSQMIDSINLATNIEVYYAASIPGGVYNDVITLNDKELPENKKGLRNGLAQQLLHQQMIELQYKK